MEPFLKWPGGKRWLLSAQPNLFSRKYNRYIEPFLGGGAVFFSLEPHSSVVGDVNADLISVYKAVRDGWSSIEVRLRMHHLRHCSKHYYETRAIVPKCRFERAARFVYLNRTCWNGLYRVNKRGQFNVPIGTKSSVILPADDFKSSAEILKRTTLLTGDFEQTVGYAQKGDLLFVDPPYVAQENPTVFKKYHTSSFCWEDQIRLHRAVKMASARGAEVVVLNADTPTLRDLYSDGFIVNSVAGRNTLAADSTKRGKRTELLATSRQRQSA